MSYPKDLDEYNRYDLVAELARREKVLHEGKCDYCGRSGLTKSCRFPGRHQAALEQAFRLGHTLCGKQHCQNLGTHTVYGNLMYVACDEHFSEISNIITNE